METKRKMEIDALTVIKLIWADRKKTMLYGIAGAIAGVVIAFSIPKFYSTSVMLAPESSSNNLMGNISSLASMVGMDMSFGDSNDAIYPEIYPDLLKSTQFLTSLFTINVKSKDGKINTTYYDYVKNHTKEPWWMFPVSWITEQIKKLKSDANAKGNGDVDPFMLTKDQYDVMKAIGNDISCLVDKKTSVITITVEAQDPLISASMADSVKQRLQFFITDYRTQKARNDLKYMEKLHKEAHDQYADARRKYAAYSDANQDLLLQSYKSEQEDLENEMQIKYNIYTQVTGQLQLAKAKVQERTPAFTTVQIASVPVKHSNKPKILFLIGFGILGVIIRSLILVFRNREAVLGA